MHCTVHTHEKNKYANDELDAKSQTNAKPVENAANVNMMRSLLRCFSYGQCFGKQQQKHMHKGATADTATKAGTEDIIRCIITSAKMVLKK